MLAMHWCFVPSSPRLQGIWSCWMEFTLNFAIHVLHCMIFRAIMVVLYIRHRIQENPNFHVCCKLNVHPYEPRQCMWGNPSPWPHTIIHVFCVLFSSTQGFQKALSTTTCRVMVKDPSKFILAYKLITLSSFVCVSFISHASSICHKALLMG